MHIQLSNTSINRSRQLPFAGMVVAALLFLAPTTWAEIGSKSAALGTTVVPANYLNDESQKAEVRKVVRQKEVAQKAESLEEVGVSKDYVLGINRFNLDEHTEVLGWKLSEKIYFGRQDGLDSGLTLVWQERANQISLSKEGLRLTRRF